MIATARSIGTAVRGCLHLVFAPGHAGTVLAHAHVLAPLKIVRPFALDERRVLVQILALGPGMCAGDDYAIDITVRAGASAVVMMQSASRVMAMQENAVASQHVTLTVESGGHLEYYPGLTIPFPGSSFVQRVHVRAAGDSRVGVVETWTTGRSVRGEHLRFRALSSRTTLTIGGRVAYADAIEMNPVAMDVGGAGVLEGHRYSASGFWHNARLDDAAPLTPRDGVLSAFGHTTDDRLYLRALGMDGYAIGETVQDAVRRVNAAWGLPPIPMRRYTS
jgi:urease accessory protein